MWKKAMANNLQMYFFFNEVYLFRKHTYKIVNAKT